MNSDRQIRPAAISGSFYPADPVALKNLVDGMLDKAPAHDQHPKAMILPHAGYIYSGEVAAYGYRLLQEQANAIKRVVLLGPTHRVPVKGLATVSVEAFETPLGLVEIDQQAIQSISQLPQIVINDTAHAQEHSLEVHLPFLQTVLKQFKLVPFAVGQATADEVSQVIEQLWGGEETVIIISSDLSHFEDYESARQHDHRTCRAIESLDFETIDHTDACGATPISGLLALARNKHYPVKLLDYRNSGDTAGDKARVVGYASYILTETKAMDSEQSFAPSRLTWDEGQQLLALAKDSIEYGLKHGKPIAVTKADYPNSLLHDQASFVTLKQNDQLRGCIGSLEAKQSLINDISDNAYSAAFRDPRFSPLTEDELNNTDISISILSPSEPMIFSDEADLMRQIQPGVDGLILEDRHHRGTFLPSVWENLPDKLSFWQQLKRKAGLPMDHWSDSIKVFRYTTQAFP